MQTQYSHLDEDIHTADDAAAVLLMLFRTSRQGYQGHEKASSRRGSRDEHHRAHHVAWRGSSHRVELDGTSCLTDSEGDTNSEAASGDEDDHLTWKQLRSRGWSYVPGSRLGESLIDYFYLPPGVGAENAIKQQNAFQSMEEVRAW